MTMPPDNSAVTINAAFLQEIKEVNQDLWRVLEEARQICDEPRQIRVEHRHWVDLLAELRDHLAMHFALEEAYGYFERPAWVAPELSQSARQLREEHKSLYAAIRDLADDADAEDRAGTLSHHTRRVAERFLAYYDVLQRHEMRENELILRAYDRDREASERHDQ